MLHWRREFFELLDSIHAEWINKTDAVAIGLKGFWQSKASQFRMPVDGEEFPQVKRQAFS